MKSGKFSIDFNSAENSTEGEARWREEEKENTDHRGKSVSVMLSSQLQLEISLFVLMSASSPEALWIHESKLPRCRWKVTHLPPRTCDSKSPRRQSLRRRRAGESPSICAISVSSLIYHHNWQGFGQAIFATAILSTPTTMTTRVSLTPALSTLFSVTAPPFLQQRAWSLPWDFGTLFLGRKGCMPTVLPELAMN
ncbi:hypothetical protein E2542_SST19328 [Spatholobus suberectus]|nr:hypothetical protein E2542_SST19328 [Spatholobus suberectus]